MYAAYLARFLVPSSVCIYLNFVGILHKEYGLNNPLLDNWTLSTVLRGIKREKGVPPVPKLPITHDILSFIHSQLNLRDSKQASFWAICLVSFFGLFRKSYLLPPSPKEFSRGTYLTRSDFTFRDSTLLIQVRWSKTIQFGQRIVTVSLVALPSSVLCPVTAVSRAFSSRLVHLHLVRPSVGGTHTMPHIGFSSIVILWLVLSRICLDQAFLRGSMGLTSLDVGVPLLLWKPGSLWIPSQSWVIGSQVLCICTYTCPCRSVCAPSNLSPLISYPL